MSLKTLHSGHSQVFYFILVYYFHNKYSCSFSQGVDKIIINRNVNSELIIDLRIII